jgi:hypothetical protein
MHAIVISRTGVACVTVIVDKREWPEGICLSENILVVTLPWKI